MKKIRNILTLALSGLFLAGFLLAAILTPDRTDSLSERRKLAQRPALRASAVADGTYMTAFEKYTLDQFPLRDGFRALKAFFSGDILRQRDNNGVYAAEGYLAKLDYPVDTDLGSLLGEPFQPVLVFGRRHGYLQKITALFEIFDALAERQLAAVRRNGNDLGTAKRSPAIGNMHEVAAAQTQHPGAMTRLFPGKQVAAGTEIDVRSVK